MKVVGCKCKIRIAIKNIDRPQTIEFNSTLIIQINLLYFNPCWLSHKKQLIINQSINSLTNLHSAITNLSINVLDNALFISSHFKSVQYNINNVYKKSVPEGHLVTDDDGLRIFLSGVNSFAHTDVWILCNIIWIQPFSPIHNSDGRLLCARAFHFGNTSVVPLLSVSLQVSALQM